MNNFNKLIDILENVKQVGLDDRTEEFRKGFLHCFKFIFVHYRKNSDYYNQQVILNEQKDEIEKLKYMVKRLEDKRDEYHNLYEEVVTDDKVGKNGFKAQLALNIKGMIQYKAPVLELEKIEKLVTKWL